MAAVNTLSGGIKRRFSIGFPFAIQVSHSCLSPGWTAPDAALVFRGTGANP